MLPIDFKRIVDAFADDVSASDFSRGKLIVQVRDELIEVSLDQREGQLWIEEDGERRSPIPWLVERVARLPLLAERILSVVERPMSYIAPAGQVLERLDHAEGAEDLTVADAGTTLANMLDRRLLGATSVIYLTSDAGEGKTTLLNKVALEQADNYRKRKTDWLLLPIPLGGRGFQRFDDSVIATLVNRFRFQMLYYEGFLELVKLGVLVPAFDGFEEVFIEGSSGEAISALGHLVTQLSSSGTCVIAARNAYFEYQSFGTQAQLFDALAGQSASFGRLRLLRWDESKFVEYASKRGVPGAKALFDAVAARFGATHPLLSRAVLVNRLVDITLDARSIEKLLERLGNDPDDYFFRFVDALLSREANEKWIDRSGEAPRPLLSIEEHHELMALVAAEMWLASAEVLKADVLDVVADMFTEPLGRGPVIARQVKERLKQHTLLVNTDGRRNAYSFDHEDFRRFYLGEALGRLLTKGPMDDLRRFLAVAALPRDTADAAVAFAVRSLVPLPDAVTGLQEIAKRELQTSFVKENGGLLILLLVERGRVADVTIRDVILPPDALKARRLDGVTFEGCHFQPSSLEGAGLSRCVWRNCRFERLTFTKEVALTECRMTDCTFGSIELQAEDLHVYEPAEILESLAALGITTSSPSVKVPRTTLGEDVRLVQRALRVFLRSTQINESVFRQKLGGRAKRFLSDLLPQLVQVGALAEVPYHGAGVQRRYRLAVPMHQLERAVSTCDGTFEGLISQLGR